MRRKSAGCVLVPAAMPSPSAPGPERLRMNRSRWRRCRQSFSCKGNARAACGGVRHVDQRAQGPGRARAASTASRLSGWCRPCQRGFGRASRAVLQFSSPRHAQSWRAGFPVHRATGRGASLADLDGRERTYRRSSRRRRRAASCWRSSSTPHCGDESTTARASSSSSGSRLLRKHALGGAGTKTTRNAPAQVRGTGDHHAAISPQFRFCLDGAPGVL